jgi:GrpB-like predicted nucleotidyltransferase (UPF0157 family)/inhibitor of KinA sporulation pathway (predicted exonuclease)
VSEPRDTPTGKDDPQAPVEVVPYDPAWPEEFDRERSRIYDVLGPRIEAVEHIGSTAIPDLAAKPTIDILVGQPKLEMDDAIIEGLNGLGYRYLGEYGIPGRHFFRKGLPPTHHLHWVEIDGKVWEAQVIFRDYMREHPEEAARYEKMKVKLAERFHNERPKYTASKTGYVEGVLERAKLWKFPPAGCGYVIVDLEATCWKEGSRPDRMEIIEIGAVRLDPKTKEVVDEFSRFVRPTEEPRLSEFCRQLTSITQEQVDNARAFPEVLREFCDWVGDAPHRFCSWGAYDLKQFLVDCARHGVERPAWLEPHLNLRRMFSVEKEVPQCTMVQALEILDLPLEGTHHRGIDDARNIAKIAKLILP